MPQENEQPQPNTPDPLTIGELISMSEAANLSGFNPDFLRQIAAKGRLKAKRSGKTWLTNQWC